MVNSKIKILFLINNLHRGGAERNFLNQANGLDKSVFDVYFATILKENTGDSFLNELEIEPNKIICFDFKSMSDVTAWLKFFLFLFRGKFDLVYSTLFFANFVNRAGKIAAFFYGTKVVIREANVADIKSPKEIFADKILSYFTHKIIAVSEAVTNSLVQKEKIKKNKIAVILNGVEIPEIILNKDEVRQKFGIAPDDFVFLNVGMMKTEQKGHKILIEAFSVLKEKFFERNLKLLLAGDGPLRQGFENFAQEKNLISDIIFVGLQKDINIIYQMSDVFVLSSLWEGCPNVLLEAMANKLPVISTNVGGASEIILHLENGYLADSGNAEEIFRAMEFMYLNGEARKNIAQNGFLTVSRDFNLQKNIDELSRLFKETVN